MLQACHLDLKGSWEEHLPLVEFTYNNSYHASILITTQIVLFHTLNTQVLSTFYVVVSLINPIGMLRT